MTSPILPHTPIDLKAVKALITRWLQPVHAGSDPGFDVSDGDRILTAIGIVQDDYDPHEEPLRAHAESAFRCGFSSGVEAGIAVTVAVLSDPLGNPQARIHNALTQATASIADQLDEIAADAASAQND